ncbi:MAG: threonine synthase [Ignavibacteria bacterium]
MSKYFYFCPTCKKEYSRNFIEENLIYLCPGCGRAERNKPLEGVLRIKYDYDEIKKSNIKTKLLNSFPGSIWNFPEIIPLDFNEKENVFPEIDEKLLKSLTLTTNPLMKLKFENFDLYAFDDTRNPTFSYKDRASILIALKAIQLGLKKISAASTGNAGSSIAGICARLGLNANIFVPKTIPESKRIQIQSYGANLFIIDGTYDDAFDLCLEVSSKKKWFNRNTAYNPLTIEGKKSAAYDIFISFKGKIPENIFIPAGDGVIVGGMYKGFYELLELGLIEKLPRLIAVQSSGSNAIVRYFQTKKFELQPAETIADSICAAAPRNLYMAYEAINSSSGFAIEVDDEEILNAQKEVIQKYGIFIEPSSAAAFAGFKKSILSGLIEEKEKHLVMFTGNGLKDINSLLKWNEKIEPKTYQQLLDELNAK